jgi:acetyl-CoA synthetase
MDSLGDITTLAEPQVVEEIVQLEQRETSKGR